MYIYTLRIYPPYFLEKSKFYPGESEAEENCQFLKF